MPAVPLPVLHARDSAFSYRCGACSRCCYHKRIQVNPYELIRLARNQGTTTTDLIARYTVDGGTALATRPDGGCVFLGATGCTVHADRPLVCRLYPLGRVARPDGTEVFVENEPHPETAGVYGQDGTVASFLESQDVAPFITAADRYYAILVRLLRSGLASPDLANETPVAGSPLDGNAAADAAAFIDADLAVRRAAGRDATDAPVLDAETLMSRHLALLEHWAGGGSMEADPIAPSLRHA